jgi:hypothetical protein
MANSPQANRGSPWGLLGTSSNLLPVERYPSEDCICYDVRDFD